MNCDFSVKYSFSLSKWFVSNSSRVFIDDNGDISYNPVDFSERQDAVDAFNLWMKKR